MKCVVLIVALLVSVPHPVSASSCEGGMTINGAIRDSQTHLGVGGVAVSTVGDDACEPTRTDSEGRFRLRLVPELKAGKIIRIRAEKDGYEVVDKIETVSELPLEIVITAKRQVKKPPSTVLPIAPVASVSLREQALTLSTEIDKFLAERESHYQGPQPTVVITGGKDDSITPDYMKQTRQIFIDEFQSRVENLHDAFTKRGLQVSIFGGRYTGMPYTAGNVDRAITGISDYLRKFALLSPPDGMYKDDSDSQLAEHALEEATKIDEMVDGSVKAMQNSMPPPKATRIWFLNNFRDCCLVQVEYLRAEILARLGPAALDTEEIRQYNEPFGFTDVESRPEYAIFVVQQYMPEFRRLAMRLKRKASPTGPQDLPHYSQEYGVLPSQQRPSDQAYEIVVTISTANDIRWGYVVVQFDQKYTTIANDLFTTDILRDDEAIDNQEVADLVRSNQAASIYAFKIARSPFLPGKPIHLLVSAPQQLYVSRVQLFQ